MSERQPGEHRNVEGSSALFDHRRQIVAIVVGARRVAIERAQQQRALTAQDPGVMQLIEHPLDPVRMLSDVFDEQNAAVDAWKVRCSDQVRQHRQVAAPQRALGGELRRAFERELDGVLRTREQAPAVVERERRGRLGAKVIRRERSGERDQARCGEGRQLKRREIAVAEPALVRRRDRGEIESVEQPRPPVASAHGDGELDAWIFGHAHHRGEPLRIGRGKALPARGHRGIDDDAMTRGFEPGDRARDRFRLDYEARRRVQTNAVGAGLHSGRLRREAKNAERSAPHSDARISAVTRVW